MANNTGPLYIDRREFARIVHHANSSLDGFDDRAALNQRRKQDSDKRVSTWTNTLEASRKAKFEARRIKAEKLEAERVRIDEMEAQVLQKQRTDAISRADKLVAEQNDLIKRFRGMQGTSDMLEVNKLQRSYRRDQKKMEIQREEFFHKKLMEQVQKDKLVEQKKQETLEAKQARVAKIQKGQLNAQIDRNLRRLVQEKKEGEQTVALAKLALEKEIQEKKDRLRINRQNRLEMVKCNDEAAVIKQKNSEKSAGGRGENQAACCRKGEGHRKEKKTLKNQARAKAKTDSSYDRSGGRAS